MKVSSQLALRVEVMKSDIFIKIKYQSYQCMFSNVYFWFNFIIDIALNDHMVLFDISISLALTLDSWVITICCIWEIIFSSLVSVLVFSFGALELFSRWRHELISILWHSSGLQNDPSALEDWYELKWMTQADKKTEKRWKRITKPGGKAIIWFSFLPRLLRKSQNSIVFWHLYSGSAWQNWR